MSNNDNLVPGFNEEKDESLKINLERITDISEGLVLYLNGYIDTYNSSFFQKKVSKVVEAGYTKLIFNCSALNYVSSTGIGSFTVFLKTVKPKGGDVVLVEIQPKVYEVFQLLGFSQCFTIKQTSEEVIAYFASGPSKSSDIFPAVITCPICQKKLRAPKPGRFRCSGCRSILAIDKNAEVSLG